MARDLTKWPRLLVTGEPVTEQQADEILVRTDNWYHFSNNKQWEQQVDALAAEYGRPLPGPGSWALADEWNKQFGILPLGYCDNNQIMSSWVGGPYGWCNWPGQIGCSTYNIGKWPSTEEVTDDWTLIAAAFPYLDLTAQLVNDEGEGQLCGQWRVQAGRCVYDPEPAERIRPVEDASPTFFLPVWREQGVSLERLRQAMDTVRAARSGT